MSLAQVIKTELYKDSHRKSSLILFIPMLLAFVITFGYSQGMIKLDLTVGGTEVFSCMDFVFIVWNVLSGLGIVGILLILFAAFQFSGEIERGQIKLMLLRIGKRSTVMLGKYLAAIIVAGVSIIGTLLVCIASYYLFVSGSSMGTGLFASTIEALSTWSIWACILLQVLMYFILIGITFLIGMFVNPFVTFILTMVIMYIGNYLTGAESFVSKLFPAYWSNQLMLSGTVSVVSVVISVCFTAALTALIMFTATILFQRQDIK